MILHPILHYRHPGRGLWSSCAGGTDYRSLWSEDNTQIASPLHSVRLERKERTMKLGQLQEKLSRAQGIGKSCSMGLGWKRCHHGEKRFRDQD